MKVHGVVVFFWHPEGAQLGCGQQRASAVVGDVPTASSAEPKQLSKRKQRSAARLGVFQRRAAATAASAAEKAAAEVAAAAEAAAAEAAEAEAAAAEEAAAADTAAEEAAVAEKVAAEKAAPAGLLPKGRPKLSPEKRKVGSAEPASPSKRASVAVVPSWQHDDWSAAGEIQVAARRWLARRYVARLRAAVPQLPPPLESGDGAPSAAEAKRRVDFSAPVPPSKRAWVETGIGAGWLRVMARAAAPAAVAAPPPAPVAVVMEAPAPAPASKRKVSFDAEVSPAKAVAGLQGDEHDDYSEAEEESDYSEEELSGSEAAEDEWWAQGGGGRGGGCFGGDFGDDAATLARAAAWQRENPELAEKQAEFFHRLGLDPGGIVAKEELLALSLSPDYRLECDICDRNYMLRRGCPCCRD